MAVNPLNGVGAYLKADANVAGRVEGRVYWPALPRDAVSGEPAPTVVIRPSGGYGLYGRGTLEVGDSRVDIDCFGATLADSFALHLDVLAALKGLSRASAGGVLLHAVRVSAAGVTAVDSQTKWPLTIASYTVIASEIPVPV